MGYLLNQAFDVNGVSCGSDGGTIVHLMSSVVMACCNLHCVGTRVLQDKSSDELRAAAACLLGAMCRGGGTLLWSAGGYYAEEALRIAVTGLEDAASVSTCSLSCSLVHVPGVQCTASVDVTQHLHPASRTTPSKSMF
jgi:hypothetical protein